MTDWLNIVLLPLRWVLFDLTSEKSVKIRVDTGINVCRKLQLMQDTRLTWTCDECVVILDTQGWGVSPRGAGYLFGSDVVTQVYCKQRTTFCMTVLLSCYCQ